ncbi:MAG: TlpA disulfide reductase family protein [Woeseiaceae bacterium]
MLSKNLIAKLLLLITINLLPLSISVADGLPPLTHKLTALTKLEHVPELRLKNMDEKIVDIKDLKGKVVVINFWATWCPPCRREMGSLERLYQATKNKNVEILAVNIGEDVETVFSFMGMVDPVPNFQIIFDPNAVSMDNWKVRGLPTTYIINPQGEIAYRAVGGREFDHPDILNKIMSLTK